METEKAFLGKLRSDEDVFADIVGAREAKRSVRSALLAGRNIAIFGPPGIGKTTLAKNIAKLLPDITVNSCDFNCLPDRPVCPQCRKGLTKGTKSVPGLSRFVRVQGSPDLTAEDLLGDIDPIKALKHGPLSPEAFSPGKIFRANNGVLFFDELNRCPEKLQNALLQVLEERKATIGSYDIDIAADFIFIATMNPKDINTERLSDVLLDRFDVVYMDYPDSESDEVSIMESRAASIAEIPQDLKALIVDFVRTLRKSDKLEVLPSVRATIGLSERAQANAVLAKRSAVRFPDIENAAVSVLAHRIRLKPSVSYLEDPKGFVRKELDRFLDSLPTDYRQGESPGGDG